MCPATLVLSRRFCTIYDVMLIKLRFNRLNAFVAFFVGALAGVPAHPRGVCYGDCSGNGIALIVLAPLVFIYFKFWNSRKGGPSFGLCLGCFAVSALVAFVIGHALRQILSFPLWSAWILMYCIFVGAFAFLIHPTRHETRN
jgi:hypothetical protein